jgi:hypothetical protein
MAFLKNKKQQRILSAALLFTASGIFFLVPSTAHAFGFSFFGDTILGAFKVLLYGIFTMFGWFASVAITIFEWAINPEYVSGASGLLNKKSVYDMWKFVRDFFNLFFILTLLYTAFTIVFQVASNYKKTLLSIVLAALFVNFSFPVTRVIIDITNVPMYYFVNQLGSTDQAKQKDYLGTVLSASKLKGILIPGAQDGGTVNFDSVGVPQFFMAIVFLFIFSISLMVLAILFVIRLAALVILLIFSSVGFAASVIPGLGKYGSMWWDKLWQYTIFGPAAMLMLVVATRFFAEISQDNTEAQFLKAGIANSNSDTASLVTSAAMFSIPIVMLWMTIGLANSFSIMGAGAISGRGQKMAKWLARNNPVSYPVRKFSSGVAQGAKARYQDSSLGKLFSGPSNLETFGRGAAKGIGTEKNWRTGFGAGTAFGKEKDKLHQKEVNEQVKKNKENQVSDSAHIKTLRESHDPFEKEVAALSLAESKGIRSAEVLAESIKSVGNNQDAVLKVLESARSEALGSIDKASNEAIMNSFYEKDATGAFKTDAAGKRVLDPDMKDAYDAYNGKLKKEGQLKVRVDYEIEQKMNGGVKEDQARSEVYNELINKLSSDDLAKQGSIHSAVATDSSLKEFLKNKIKSDPQYYQEAFKKMSKADRDKWTDAGISPEVNKQQSENGAALRAKIQGIKKENNR